MLENVRLALQAKARNGPGLLEPLPVLPHLEDEAYELPDQVLMEDRWAPRPRTLTHGEQRKLEIAILLALDPEVLLWTSPPRA